MTFKVLQSPAPEQMPVGRVLPLTLAAEYLELNAQGLYAEAMGLHALVDDGQCAVTHLGFVLKIVPDNSDLELQ